MSTVADLFKAAGGVSKVSAALGAPLGTVSVWASRNKVPAERVLDVERSVGISRHELRPDLYPLPAAPAGDGAGAGEGARVPAPAADEAA